MTLYLEQIAVDAAGSPSQVAFDASGNAYVAYIGGDWGIRTYGPGWTGGTTIWNVTSVWPWNRQMIGVGWNAGQDRVYAVRNDTIWTMDPDGGNRDEMPMAPWTTLKHIAFDAEGITMFLTEATTKTVQRFTLGGIRIQEFQIPRTVPGETGAFGLCVAGTELYVGDIVAGTVWVFDVEADTGVVDPTRQIGEAGDGAGQLRQPYGVAVGDGQLYVADRVRNKVIQFTTDGEYVDEGGVTLGGVPKLQAAAVSPEGDLAVSSGYLNWGEEADTYLWTLGGAAPAQPDFMVRGIGAEICGDGPCEVE